MLFVVMDVFTDRPPYILSYKSRNKIDIDHAFKQNKYDLRSQMHFFNNSTFFFYKSGCNFCAVTLILQRGGYQRKVMIIILSRYGRIEI